MPSYECRFPSCWQVYEVKRPMSRATDHITCLIDNTLCEQVIAMPMVLTKSDQFTQAGPPQQSAGWSHAGYSHGTGEGGHGHGPDSPS